MFGVEAVDESAELATPHLHRAVHFDAASNTQHQCENYTEVNNLEHFD